MSYPFRLILFIAVVLTAFVKKDPGYTIAGTVAGLEDGTWLYLRLAKPDKKIDSCQVSGGRFRMKGAIAGKAAQVYLFTAGYTNYTSFWLENTAMQLELRAGSFKEGTVTGSATNDEYKQFSGPNRLLDQQLDSLEKVRNSATDAGERKSLSTRLAGIRQQKAQLERDYVRRNPGSLVAAYILNVYASTWGKDTTSVLYEQMSPELKASAYGMEIQDFIALNRKIDVGGPFADFEQLNTAGTPVKLSNIKARYILLDFWASWCGPCRQENPNLVKTYARFRDKGFTVLGVSLDENKKAWLKAVADDNLTWENVSDLRGDQNKAALIYGISGIPDNFLIDGNGTIVARNLRGKKLDDKLEELFR
jgi:peroxiredoxin